MPTSLSRSVLWIVVWHHSARFDLPDLNAILKEAREVTEPETGRSVIQKRVDSFARELVECSSLSVPASAIREPGNAISEAEHRNRRAIEPEAAPR